MALFTTFITTPLLHLIYIRHLPELTAEALSMEEYSVLAPVRLPKVTPSLVQGICYYNLAYILVCKLFSGMKNAVSCKVLLLHEITDRPSSYFYSEFTKVFNKVE